jgi:hypothetical protein
VFTELTAHGDLDEQLPFAPSENGYSQYCNGGKYYIDFMWSTTNATDVTINGRGYQAAGQATLSFACTPQSRPDELVEFIAFGPGGETLPAYRHAYYFAFSG